MFPSPSTSSASSPPSSSAPVTDVLDHTVINLAVWRTALNATDAQLTAMVAATGPLGGRYSVATETLPSAGSTAILTPTSHANRVLLVTITGTGAGNVNLANSNFPLGTTQRMLVVNRSDTHHLTFTLGAPSDGTAVPTVQVFKGNVSVPNAIGTVNGRIPPKGMAYVERYGDDGSTRLFRIYIHP